MHSEICEMSKNVFAKALEMQRTRDLISKMHYKRLKKNFCYTLSLLEWYSTKSN